MNYKILFLKKAALFIKRAAFLIAVICIRTIKYGKI